MKTTLRKMIAAVLIVNAANVNGETPMWLRQSAISPDGSTIAFCYKGNIFTVATMGGEARQITYNSSYDHTPVWSPDSRSIAFASNREGSMDIFVISANGGQPRRITYDPTVETPIAFKDNNTLIYSANGMPSTESMQFPSNTFKQIYEVNVNAPRQILLNRMVSSLPMEHISISDDGGTWLYNDKKGYEDTFRKHHTSSITRDIWAWTPLTDKYEKLTSFNGEDRDPVWGEGNSFYYLSEENGSFNVYRRTIDSNVSTALTHFTNHPVRNLTRSNNGTLCFSFNGELFTLKDGAEPQKVIINVTTDNTDRSLIRRQYTNGATSIAVSPDGKEIAFILHGDVFVTSTDYATTRQITDTPEQERNVDFAPDGKSIVYDSERNGVWQIYQTTSSDNDCKGILRSKSLMEENLTSTDVTSFQPLYSPDGKYVAYLENRTTLKVLNIKNGKSVVAMDGRYEYSYRDGDQTFCWSPDGKWLLTEYIGIGGWNNTDIALVKADGSELYDLTQSGYSDSNPKWVLDGKAMIWKSDRAGYRSHGSWGAESDYYIMFFDVEAYDKFKMNKEDLEVLEAQKSEKEKKKEEKQEDKKEKSEKNGKVEKVEELAFNLDNLEDRIIRLTVNSANIVDGLLDKKGENFYYEASFEGKHDLWKHDLKGGSTTKLVAGIGATELVTDKDIANMFYLQGGMIKKLTVGGNNSVAVPFEAVFNYRPAAEREYIFEHCWRQVNEKFYDPKIHGIDWKMYHDNYKKFLPYINNNYDFAELLSEMLGELNGSHTGSGYRGGTNLIPVGSLGLFYDNTYGGKGLKIKEIMAKSPLAQKKNDVKAGMIITKIDGIELTDSIDHNYLLTGKAGKTVTLTVAKDDDAKGFDVTIKPINLAEENSIMYSRWVERNRKYVEQKTEGKIGYIHIKSMDSPSFRTLYSELLGKYRNCDGVIIDTRHNGGGWLHDDVITLLSAKEYARYTPRGQYVGSDPYNKYTKKSCMLVCEDNYSNAHGTPWLYKELGVGKLIGAPVPGTMTAVWWETQIDPTLYFGIPQVGCQDRNGKYLENQELQPDIVVYNDPADVQKGKDAQLDAAIEEMLKETGNK